MNLVTLEYFRSVAREKGFTKAAQVLRVQQSSLSRGIKALEDELGVALFDRNTRTVFLTEAGERLLVECRKLFEVLDAIPVMVRPAEGQYRGTFQFFVTDSLLASVLPEVLKAFIAKHPLVLPSVATGIGPSLRQKLERRELDFGVAFSPVERGFKITSEPILPVPFYFAISTLHKKDLATLSSFIAAREREDNRSADEQERALLAKIAPRAQTRYSANSFALHKALVLRGAGISIFPEFFIREEVENGTLTRLNSSAPLWVDLKLITRSSEEIPQRTRDFIQMLKLGIEADKPKREPRVIAGRTVTPGGGKT